MPPRRWPRPKVFEWLQHEGNIAHDEKHRTFKRGIGMLRVVAAPHLDFPGDDAILSVGTAGGAAGARVRNTPALRDP